LIYYSFVVFRSWPPSTHSKSQFADSSLDAKAFAVFVWQTLRRPQFLIHLAAFGISQGVFYALIAQMDKIIISASFVGIDDYADNFIQLTYLASEILGCVVSGALLCILRKHVK
jgi:hypothetical protein